VEEPSIDSSKIFIARLSMQPIGPPACDCSKSLPRRRELPRNTMLPCRLFFGFRPRFFYTLNISAFYFFSSRFSQEPRNHTLPSGAARCLFTKSKNTREPPPYFWRLSQRTIASWPQALGLQSPPGIFHAYIQRIAGEIAAISPQFPAGALPDCTNWAAAKVFT